MAGAAAGDSCGPSVQHDSPIDQLLPTAAAPAACVTWRPLVAYRPVQLRNLILFITR